MANVNKSIKGLIAAAVLTGGTFAVTIENKPPEIVSPNEIVSERRADAKVFNRGGNQKTAVINATGIPMHYWDEADNAYKNIDTAIYPRSLAMRLLSKWEMTAEPGLYKPYFDKDKPWNYRAESPDGKKWIEFEALFDESDDLSINVETKWNGVKETITLKSAKAPTVLKWLVENEGVSPDSPTAEDANGTPVPVVETVSGDTLIYTIEVKDAVYPIEVDPSVGFASSATTTRSLSLTGTTYQTARDSTAAAVSSSGAIQYRWTTGYNMKRTLSRFDLDVIPNGSTIDGATVNSESHDTVSGTGSSLIIIKAATSLIESDITTGTANDFEGWSAGPGDVWWDNLTALSDSIPFDVANLDSMAWTFNAAGLTEIENAAGDTLQVFTLATFDIFDIIPPDGAMRIDMDNESHYIVIDYSLPLNSPTNFILSNPTTTTLDADWTNNTSDDIDSLSIYTGAGAWVKTVDKIPPVNSASTTITGLSLNTEYIYKVRPDSSTSFSYSNIDTLYTLANPPTTWAFTETSQFNVTPSFSGNSNPAGTTYAIRDSTRWTWISSTGGKSATAVWRTEAQWEAITISPLRLGKTYKFGVVGRNGDTIETTYTWDDVVMSSLFTESEAIRDGRIAPASSNYSAVRDTTAGYTNANMVSVGQTKQSETFYSVKHSFFQFPLPELMSSVLACTLYVYGSDNQSTTDFEIYIHGANAYRPLLANPDYINFNGRRTGQAHNGTVLNDTWNSSSYSATWNQIIFNAAGLDSMEATGPDTLAVAMISKEDFDNSAPTGNEYVVFESSSEAGKEPYISFSYVGASPAGFAITAVDSDTLRLKWDDNTADEDSFLVRNSGTGAWIAAVDADVDSLRLGGLDINTSYSFLIEVKGGIGDGLQSDADSCYTDAAVPGKPTLTGLTNVLYKFVLDVSSNPAYTEFAIQDSVTGKFIGWVQGADDTLRSAVDWRTYADWGGAAGDTLLINIGQGITIRTKARSGQ